MTIFVYGDQTEAAKYRSTVEHYKTELVRNFGKTSPFQSYWRQLSDTAKVHLRLINGQPFAYLYTGYKIYMESGFLFHENNYRNNELAYIPSTLWFSPFVQATTEFVKDDNPATLINASEDKRLIDRSESLAVGGKYKVKEITGESYSGVPYTFISDTPIYVEDLWRKKLYQTFCVPSVFTGKLKLMVQAIYGSRRNDYSITLDPLTGRPALSSGPYLLLTDTEGFPVRLESFGDTSGIYRDDLDNYWLITMAGEFIKARRMNYDKNKVKAFKRTDNKLNEAYVLSLLIPEHEIITIGTQTLTAGYEALAYGWKFNQRGDECSIVVKKGIDEIYINPVTGGWIGGIETRLVTVKLETDVITGLPKVISSTLVTEGRHIPYFQTTLFTPFYPLNCMMCLLGDKKPGNIALDLSAPIYCYYSNDGAEESSELVVFTVKNGKQTSTPAKGTYTNEWWSQGAGYYPASYFTNPQIYVYKGAGMDINSSGISIANDNFFVNSGYDYGGSSTQIRWIELNSDMGQPSGTGEWFWVYNIDNGGKATSFNNSFSNISSTIKTTFIIPMNDAESAVIGKRESYLAAKTSSTSGIFSNNVIWKKVDLEGNATFPDCTGINMDLFAPTTYNEADDPTSQYVDFEKPATIDYTMKLYTSVDLDGTPTVVTDSLNPQPFIDIKYTDPIFYHPLEVRSSYSGSKLWTQQDTLITKDDWPDHERILFSVPVGWA